MFASVKQIILTGTNSENHTSINGNLQFLARMPQIQKWVWSIGVISDWGNPLTVLWLSTAALKSWTLEGNPQLYSLKICFKGEKLIQTCLRNWGFPKLAWHILMPKLSRICWSCNRLSKMLQIPQVAAVGSGSWDHARSPQSGSRQWAVGPKAISLRQGQLNSPVAAAGQES